MRANSSCFQFPVIVVCSLLTLCFSFSPFLFNLVTDENSESESDTEEKLKGEKRKLILTHTLATQGMLSSRIFFIHMISLFTYRHNRGTCAITDTDHRLLL